MPFSGVGLPAFIAVALLFAIWPRLRGRAGLAALAMVCVGAAGWMLLQHRTPPTTSGAPSIEVDLRVSRGEMMELWVNDWQHPPERVHVMAGTRHVYRFTNVPRTVTLLRLDPLSPFVEATEGPVPLTMAGFLLLVLTRDGRPR